MDRWHPLSDDALHRLGAGPLGPAPDGLVHFRALFDCAFSPPLLVDVQLPARRARLRLIRQNVLGDHAVCITLALPDDLALPEPARVQKLRHQDPEPNMRDGCIYMGQISSGRCFIARDLSERGHFLYFSLMAEVACRLLGRDDPALRCLS